MNYAGLKYIVENKLPPGLLDIWMDRLLSDPRIKKLWGNDQPTGFERRVITLAIYKDLSGLGYEKVLSSVDCGVQIQSKSFAHNTKLIRKMLISWAKEQIKLEGPNAWNEAAQIFYLRKGGLKRLI